MFGHFSGCLALGLPGGVGELGQGAGGVVDGLAQGLGTLLVEVHHLSLIHICFANNIRTTDGGTHEDGFKRALTRVMNDYARKYNILKENDKNLSGEDVREGLTCVISVKLKEAQFEGQTKAKLGNTEMSSLVSSMLYKQMCIRDRYEG